MSAAPADDDFPPPQRVAIEGIAHGLDMIDAYLASPEFQEIKRDNVMASAFAKLNALAAHDAEATAWAAYGWLQNAGAGMPYLPGLEQGARDDARFWAETATPPELECYALAACDRLAGISSGAGMIGGHAMFASRQIKRLAGALFRRMSPKEQTAFAGWINSQIGDQGK
jgi:hypothetical protein